MGRIIKWVVIGVVALVVIAVIAGRPDDDSTASATPTPEVTDGSNESPAATSEPTPIPTPTGTPELAFEPITLTGTGSSVPEFSIPEDQPAIATITHQGASNFAIFTLGADGEQQDLLVNTIGNYSGTVLFDETEGVHSIAFEVTADGPWTIAIRPIVQARPWDPAESLNGTGDDVVLVAGTLDGLTTAQFTHSGDGNFAVFGYAGSGIDLIVNEIGAYDAEHRISADTFLLAVTADGAWSITIR